MTKSMTECLFCGIAASQIKSWKVYEDQHCFGFLDINPASEGHTLMIPKKHYENVEAMPDDALVELMAAIKALVATMKDKLGADATNILLNNGKAAGQLVNHVHVHVIPRKSNDGLAIGHYIRMNMTPEQLDAMQKKLAEQQKPKSSKDDWERGF